MTTSTTTEVHLTAAATTEHVREWKIYSFLVSALAVALAIEVIRLRSSL